MITSFVSVRATLATVTGSHRYRKQGDLLTIDNTLTWCFAFKPSLPTITTVYFPQTEILKRKV